MHFRTNETDKRSHDFLHRIADIAVLLRRLSDYGGKIDRTFFARHFTNVKNRKWGRVRIMPEVIAERPFYGALVKRDFSFQNKLSVRGNSQWDGASFGERHGTSSQKSAESDFIHSL